MLTTTHYGLNIVEGTDVVNPLVQQNPNYTTIDAAMFANKQGSIGSGTELTAGTVHTITRANPDSNYVRFTATSNWSAGDSMVVDSTPVSVYLSDGTVPKSGAYVINTEVLILVSGSRATILTSRADQNAAEVPYNNSGTGLSATTAQQAIDELHSNANSILTYTGGLIGTVDGGTSLNSNAQYTRAEKCGHTVVLNLRITIPTINTPTVVFHLATDLLPAQNIGYVYAFNLWDRTVSGAFLISSNGDITAQPDASGKDISLRLTYFA